MIALVGALRDSAIAYVAQRLMEARARFLLLDPRQLGTRLHLEWEADVKGVRGRIRHDGKATSLSELQAVYVHLLSNSDRPAPGKEGLPTPLPVGAAHWMLHQFLETLPVLVCNRPSAMATNYSKTWQQQVIASQGFLVPRTLVTNVPSEARRFYEECHRRVIYKSLSARRSIVKRLRNSDLARLGSLAACPTQFQEWVPGTDIRVHVMGARLFPTEILTDAVDYRYSGREGLPRSMRAVELPDELAGRCFKLATSLGLVSAGIDLRRDLEGQFYCFEVNPTPGFMFYQQYTNQRIGDALVDLLRRPPVAESGMASGSLSRGS